MSDITIRELVKIKSDIELEIGQFIQKKLNEFKERTGVTPESLELGLIGHSHIGASVPDDLVVTNVNLVVKIGV